MKRTHLIGVVGLLLLALMVSGCGEDGRDGKLYYGIDYGNEAPVHYGDTIPSLPELIEFGEHYEVQPDSYQVEYMFADSLLWSFDLILNAPARGGSGGLFENGEDADDTVVTLYCLRSGPDVISTFEKGSQAGEASYMLERDVNGTRVTIIARRMDGAEPILDNRLP